MEMYGQDLAGSTYRLWTITLKSTLLLHVGRYHLCRAKDDSIQYSIIPPMSRVAHDINKVIWCRVEVELGERQAQRENQKIQIGLCRTNRSRRCGWRAFPWRLLRKVGEQRPTLSFVEWTAIRSQVFSIQLECLGYVWSGEVSKYSGHDRSGRRDIPDSWYDVRKRIGPVEIDTSPRGLVSDMYGGRIDEGLTGQWRMRIWQNGNEVQGYGSRCRNTSSLEVYQAKQEGTTKF